MLSGPDNYVEIDVRPMRVDPTYADKVYFDFHFEDWGGVSTAGGARYGPPGTDGSCPTVMTATTPPPLRPQPESPMTICVLSSGQRRFKLTMTYHESKQYEIALTRLPPQ